jgi:ABC-type transporter Mla maintaining outer membrane lipid asymmetry ATPase subunit MlaF
LRPEVLLLDNPLAGLDLRHRAWWLNLLEQLSRGHEWMNGQRTTLIVTTNDLRLWRGEARQFAFLRDKRFVVLGNWDQVEAASDELVRELRTSAAHDQE